MSVAAKQLLSDRHRLNLHWLETGEGEPFTSHIAEERAPYNADPIDAELSAKLSQLDNRQKQRILWEIEEMLENKKLKEQINRAQHGGGSEERHCPSVPPRQKKQGRSESA